MKKGQIKISESELTEMIQESVMRVLNENVEEGKFLDGIRNFGRQLGAGVDTLFNKQSGGFGDRIKAAGKNYKAQGKYNDLNTLITQIKEVMEFSAGRITPESTIGQLISYLNSRKGGTRTGMNRRLNEMDDEML